MSPVYTMCTANCTAEPAALKAAITPDLNGSNCSRRIREKEKVKSLKKMMCNCPNIVISAWRLT